MCSQFELITKATKKALRNQVKIPDTSEQINIRVLPYQTAPVIAVNKNQNSILQLSPMSFSLVPSWSKDPKVKFATHNARIETVLEKPTWKDPFLTKHCIVPLTGFFESAYEGPEAGNIIKFRSATSQASQTSASSDGTTESDDHLLFAAGIYDIWKDPSGDPSKKIFSFSILTTEPTKYILEHGHDRSPLFLSFDDAKEWLHLQSSSTGMIDFLLSKNQKPDLDVSIDRALKPGWEKRR